MRDEAVPVHCRNRRSRRFRERLRKICYVAGVLTENLDNIAHPNRKEPRRSAALSLSDVP